MVETCCIGTLLASVLHHFSSAVSQGFGFSSGDSYSRPLVVCVGTTELLGSALSSPLPGILNFLVCRLSDTLLFYEKIVGLVFVLPIEEN